MMKAVRVPKFGGTDVLTIATDIPKPKPAAKDVLIHVKAIGVNPVETHFREGHMPGGPTPPFTLGSDCAGIVEEVGSDVTSLKAGDRVWTWQATSGSHAEYASASEGGTFLLVDELSFEEGAALGIPYMTAYRALVHKGHAKSGETVLVHGASGATGVGAVQLGKVLGLKVIGTGGTKEGLEIVKKAGADEVYNHRDKEYLAKLKESCGGVDLVIEMASHFNLGKDLTIMKPGGRIVVIGARGPVEINPGDMILNEVTISGLLIFKATLEEGKESAEVIAKEAKAGRLHPIVGKRFKLEEIATAHKDLMEGSGALGRTVLTL
ncbi:hypothetical protein BSKO_09251 [Bryopsis sp. KO-2023]|nr:hypothetical protein BSKO_09251 [Bryopsis sp. KO-2023]